MPRSKYAPLLDFLQRELGDALLVALCYDESGHDVLHETPAARTFIEDTATIEPAAIHDDLVISSMQAQMDRDRYGVGTDAKLFRSEFGTTCQLIESRTAGVVFVVHEDTAFEVPTFVDECLAKLE